jgi:UDP-2,3-diacylglucosamine hydrolase
MNAAYFFSDVHLGLGSQEEEKHKENELLGFLRSIRGSASMVVVAGDLFDFWFEYRTVIPKGFHRTLAALQDLTDAGIPVHFLAGNHDFWLGDFFSREIGMVVHPEPFELVIDGKRVFVHHGDGLADNDLGYRIIKPMLRSRFNIRLYRWLHPDLGVPLARGSSRTSRSYTSGKDFGEESGMLRFAERRIREGSDYVVMGHRHVPALTPVGGGVYVNLGDWITHKTYGVFRNGTMELLRGRIRR